MIEIIVVIVVIGSVIANVLLTALNYKLYTEYWKDISITRRLEKKNR